MTPPDEFPSDRANRIADAVEDIERNVARLRELRDLPREEYMAPGKQDRRDASSASSRRRPKPCSTSPKRY